MQADTQTNTWRELWGYHRGVLLAVTSIALLGIVLAVEGAMHGSLRHRLFAILLETARGAP